MNSKLREHQSSIVNQVRDWSNILWREWRNCNDEEYARHLFELVVEQPISKQATLVLILLGMLYGTLGGYLMALLMTENTSFGAIGLGITLGIIIGGLGGLCLGLGLIIGCRSTWGAWLQSLIPSVPLIAELDNLIFPPLYLRAVVGLSSVLGVGITATFFFGQSDFNYYVLLIGLIIVSSGGFFYRTQATLFGISVAILASLSFGLFFGLGFTQLLGQVIGPFNVSNSARVVGLAVGIGAGWFFGRGTGLIGLLIGQAVVSLLIISVSLNLVLIGWLLGFLMGGVAGNISPIGNLVKRRLIFATAYQYRTWYWWWRQRPPATEVITILKRHATSEVWVRTFRELEAEQKQLATVELQLVPLQRPTWIERFATHHALVTLGDAALPYLLTIIGHEPLSLQETALWLARSIAHETTKQLAGHANQMLCPICLTCCSPHSLHQSGFSIIYYGCRTCRQSREFFYCPQGVVAILDSPRQVKEPKEDEVLTLGEGKSQNLLHQIATFFSQETPLTGTHVQPVDVSVVKAVPILEPLPFIFHTFNSALDQTQAGLLQVNWLVHQTLFDFDRVEIIQATDEEVERFALQVGNDTDPLRRPRYLQMRCTIAPTCHLSENTLRILQWTFGLVSYGK